MKVNRSRNVLIILLAFLGLGAIGGGIVFIFSPSGKLMGMPLAILNNSPFNDFLFPGIILFVVLGLMPIALIVALVKKPTCKFASQLNFFKDMHWSWTFSIYIAFALIIWLQTQMFFINGVSWLHNFYMFFAIAIIFVALLPGVRILYKEMDEIG